MLGGLMDWPRLRVLQTLGLPNRQKQPGWESTKVRLKSTFNLCSHWVITLSWWRLDPIFSGLSQPAPPSKMSATLGLMWKIDRDFPRKQAACAHCGRVRVRQTWSCSRLTLLHTQSMKMVEVCYIHTRFRNRTRTDPPWSKIFPQSLGNLLYQIQIQI